MKKHLFLLAFSSLSLVTNLVLTSCNQDNKNQKIHLDYGTIRANNISDITDLKELRYDEFSSKISRKESFMLAIYGDYGCGCWSDFRKVLTQFVNETHVNIQYTSAYELLDKDTGLYLVPADLPSVAIYEKGKLKIQYVYLRDDRMMFKNYTNFKEFVDKNVVLPKMYYLEKEVLDTYIESNKEFNLYVGRNGCPDCQQINLDLLNDWNTRVNEVNDNLYIFDIQDYYPTKEATDEQKALYQSIKDYYGLSELNNKDLGFSTGMVPTFQRRKGLEVKDMITVLNDSVIDGEVKKLSSYFTKERVAHMDFLKDTSIKTILDEMELSNDLYDEKEYSGKKYYVLNEKFNKTYHYPIVEQFLATYVK